jgi:hypothetical protein
MRLTRSSLVLLALLLAGACGSAPKGSGFLGDEDVYASLQPSDFDSDVLVWRSPTAEPGSYDAFLVDPVAVHLNEDGRERDLDPKETDALAAHFRQQLEEQLGKGYSVVEGPGPRVMRIRAALTDVDPNTVALNILPQTVIMGFGIGGATMEAEFLDAESGARLAAVMADASGTRYKYLNGLSEWGHAQEVLDYWAEMIRERMDVLHGKE